MRGEPEGSDLRLAHGHHDVAVESEGQGLRLHRCTTINTRVVIEVMTRERPSSRTSALLRALKAS